MSTAEAPPRLPEAPGHGSAATLDRRRPLTVWHTTGRLTLAAVSIAWLHGLSRERRERLAARHLSAGEAAQCPASAFRRRRDEWLAGRLAVKHCVGAYQQRHWGSASPPRDVRVSVLTGGMRAGKPVVDAPVEVGLSHSGDFAVAACGPHAVGVDLEHRSAMPPLICELLARDGAPDSAGPEARRLAAMPPAMRWACKEAVLKHYGFGLRVDTENVRLTGWAADGAFTWRAGPGLLRLAPAADTRRPESWVGMVDGYALALAWQGPQRRGTT